MMADTFTGLYNSQLHFQELVLQKKPYSFENPEKLPCDSVHIASYHLQALAEEFGELVKSDKRWKNYRNTHYDKVNKCEELADCFIVLFNVAMYSDIDATTLLNTIREKIKINIARVAGEE